MNETISMIMEKISSSGPQIQTILLYAVPMILSAAAHELAHAYSALVLGDDTARRAGRITFNPIKHLDFMGTLVFVITAYIGGFVIGWAKPVPVNPAKLRGERKGMMLVAAAGPLTNLVLAVFCALVLHLCLKVLLPGVAFDKEQAEMVQFGLNMLVYAVNINIALAIFNMLPVVPLDGSKVLIGLMPLPMARQFVQSQRFGMMILLALMASGILSKLLSPVMRYLTKILLP